MIITVERGLCVCVGVGVCEALPTLLFKCALHYWVTEGVGGAVAGLATGWGETADSWLFLVDGMGRL